MSSEESLPTVRYVSERDGVEADISSQQAVANLTFDAFEQLSVLGQGGYGTVLLVRKKTSSKLYALKAMVKSKFVRAETAARVLNENEVMQSLRHPFIMRMYGAFQDVDRFYFILEFVSGGDLYSALEKLGPTFPEDWCRVHIAEIAMALEALHDLGYMYRDLKLENVLVAGNGHLKLGDFGLARKVVQDHSKDRNSIVGTVTAMAPEIFTDKSYGNSVDWWSLGIIFTEMLLGEAPLTVSSPDGAPILQDLLKSFASGTHLRPFPSNISDSAASLGRGLLTVDTDVRITSAATLREHAWFKEEREMFKGVLDWEALYSLRVPAPLEYRLESDIASGSNHRSSTAELMAVEKQFSAFIEEEAHQSAFDTSAGALCDAASRNDIETLRKILAAGGNVNVGDYDRRTAIHLAASEGKLEVVRFLVEEAGADHSPKDRWAGTPLDDATRHSHDAVIAYLRGKGAQASRVAAPSRPKEKSSACVVL